LLIQINKKGLPIIAKGFPFYGVSLTYAAGMHQGVRPGLEMCRICISQRDAIERKPFRQQFKERYSKGGQESQNKALFLSYNNRLSFVFGFNEI
jgi:hypothetical protein